MTKQELYKLTVRQLRHYIKDNRLFKNYQRLKKDELINKILEVKEKQESNKEISKKLLINTGPFDISYQDYDYVKKSLEELKDYKTSDSKDENDDDDNNNEK